MLKNTDFSELSAQGKPNDWPSAAADEIRITKEDLPANAKAALQVTLSTTGKSLGQIGQSVSLKAGHVYRVNFDLRSSAPNIAFVQLKILDGRKELKRIQIGKSSDEWESFEEEVFLEKGDKATVLMRYQRKPENVGTTAEFANLSFVDLGVKTIRQPELEEVRVTPTFEAAGVVMSLKGDPSEKLRGEMQYREKGRAQWMRGLPMETRRSENEVRASVLGLREATEYEVRCDLFDDAFKTDGPISSKQLTFKTWSGEVPIGKTIRLPGGVSTEAITISDQGTADAWVLYTGDPEKPSVIDVADPAAQAILFEKAAFVILENITIKGGLYNGILVKDSTNIRIRRCDISGWGETGKFGEGKDRGRTLNSKNKLINYQAGIKLDARTSRIVVEDNFIHSPRGTANSWQFGHPLGPEAVVIANSEGNHVLRNNDMIADENHWWNDTVESISNIRVNGGPYRDTDMSGNIMAFANDDGTELDGGQINVRFFENWIQWAFCGVSTAPNMAGPSYIYRNLLVLGDSRGKANFSFKTGGARFENQGRSYFFNNTAISNNAGLSTGHMGMGASPITSRNNAHVANTMNILGEIEGNYDLDYNIAAEGAYPSGNPKIQAHGIAAVPDFKDPAKGDYRMKDGGSWEDAGAAIPGVSDVFSGKAPDIGAFESNHGEDFPVRRGWISALPKITTLEIIGEDADVGSEINLSMAPEAGSTWVAHSNAEWLSVDPPNGSSGRNQKVRLTVKREGLSILKHRAAVTFRTDQGYNRTVFIIFNVRPEHPYTVEIEAEATPFTGTFVKMEDPEASGGAYLVPPYNQEKPLRFGPRQKNENMIPFEFEVPADGHYYISGRVMIPNPDGFQKDSYYMRMDGGELIQWSLGSVGKEEWNWQQIQGGEGSNGMAFQLSKGKHRFEILHREPGPRLDLITITNEPK